MCQQPAPPSALLVRAAFNGNVYGRDYLTLRVGDHVLPRQAPADPEGWVYGLVLETNVAGWYPPQYAV